MDIKNLHNLALGPVLAMGLLALGFGSAWLIASEPWLLDQGANEALLGTSFAELFSADINEHLPAYLMLAYRFFGWWINSIGLLILGYSIVTRMGTRLARQTILTLLFIILVGMTVIQQTYIPTSPFLVLTGGLWALWSLSLYGSIRLNKGPR